MDTEQLVGFLGQSPDLPALEQFLYLLHGRGLTDASLWRQGWA